MPGGVRFKPQQVASLEAELLRRVRARGGLSRVQLARELKLAPSTAGIYVDRLVREGFLLELEASGHEAAGRPPLSLVPNPEGGRFIGVDFEARNLMATVVNFSQQPLRQVHRTLCGEDSAAQILRKIEQAIEEVMARDARPVLGIGVGVPGLIDPVTNVAVHYEFIQGWDNVPLGAHLEARFGVPVFLENNIRSMALAELWFGAGQGLRHIVCIGIRSGIAAGVVVNGQLLQGTRHRAGEIGHWICPVPAELAPEGATSAEGGWRWEPRARLEQIASLPAILSRARRHGDAGRGKSCGEQTIEDVLAAARAGDELACSLVRAAGRVHGWVAHQVNELFNPEKIIFAGPLAEAGDLFLSPVREMAGELGSAGRDAVIVNSSLGRYNGAVGAAALALHQWKPTR